MDINTFKRAEEISNKIACIKDVISEFNDLINSNCNEYHTELDDIKKEMTDYLNNKIKILEMRFSEL